MTSPRARSLGLDFPGETGPNNAITDVAGVAVGYTTLLEGDGPLVVGKGPVRTGVTAVLPRPGGEPAPVWAGFHALNGNGEMTGVHWVQHGGCFSGPVCVTNTHSLGLVHHAVTRWMIETHGEAFGDQHVWVLPVVAETYDGVLNDINGQHVREEHVFEALAAATGGAVAEGNVGGGTGMICYEFKGGTGTASRRVRAGGRAYAVGALVQANHGRREMLTILGVPVGRHLREDAVLEDTPLQGERGSIIVVLATDAPMMPHQLGRLAQRAAIGVGRHGTPGGNSSGDLFLAFSVANPIPRARLREPELTMRFVPDDLFDPLYLGAVEATEEAVVNALVAAEDMTTLKPGGKVCRAIPHDALLDVMSRYGRVRWPAQDRRSPT